MDVLKDFTVLLGRRSTYGAHMHDFVILQAILLQFLADIPASTMTINTISKHKYRTPYNITFFINQKRK